MKFTSITILLSVLGVIFSTPSYSKISVQEISDLANHISAAAERRDVRDLLLHLTSDVVITIPREKIQRVSSNKQSRNYVARIFPLVSRYKHVRKNELIKIDEVDHNQALLTFDLTEYFSVDEEFFSEKHKEEWRFKKVEGKLQVYRVVVKYEF